MSESLLQMPAEQRRLAAIMFTDIVGFSRQMGSDEACTLRLLGKEAEAQAEAAEVLQLSLKFSLEVHKERAPIKDPAVLERHIAALQRAGLK